MLLLLEFRLCGFVLLSAHVFQFVGQTNARKAFRSFLRLSGSADSFLDAEEIKKSLKIKRINCAPVRMDSRCVFRPSVPAHFIALGTCSKCYVTLLST